MKKEVLLSRLRQFKKDVDNANDALINEAIVTMANRLITDAKEYYKEDLSDLEVIKTAQYGSVEKGSKQEASVTLGQAIVAFEEDVEGHAVA